MHVRLSKPMTKLPSSRECDLPVHHMSLTIQADAIDWVIDHIKDALEEDEYVVLKDCHEIVQRDCNLEHHGGI